MRTVILCTLFGVTAGAAHAAPECGLPKAGPIQVTDRHVETVPSPATLPPPTSSQAGLSEAAALPASVPSALTDIPFARHVAGAGAAITDLGLSHGMHSIVARSGDEFMVFQITPDGQAAVSGALTELTAAQLSTAAKGNVTPLVSQHGLDALFVRSGAQFQVFYVTPDSERVIPGVLWDSTGKDLTRDQVAHVPGAVPSVSVGDMPTGQGGTAPVAALPLLQKAAYGTVGSASAPHLWMLIDAQCIYSIRAYQMLRPFVEAGKLRLSIIPISVLDYEDNGQSTKSALALLSKPPEQLVTAWQAGALADPPVAEASARLQANSAIAQAIGLQGTPTLIWKKPDGTEGRIDGLPTSIETLITSIGG